MGMPTSSEAPANAQSEQVSSTPETPAAAPTPAAPVDRKAAAMAALGDDFGKESADVGDGSSAGDDKPTPVVSPADPPKVEEKPKPLAALSPELAAAAKADKRLQEQSQALKAEREAFQQERTKWETERAQATQSAESERRKFLSDPVAYADEHKLTPQQRYELGNALAWSSQPEDKRPANWRGSGNGKVMSEIEQVRAQAAKAAADLEAFKQEQAQREQQIHVQQQRQAAADYLAQHVTEATPLVQAFLSAHPGKAREDMVSIAMDLQKELGDAEAVTEAMVMKKYEELLDQQSAWFRKKAPTPVTQQAGKPAGSPPASVTASPVRAQNGVNETREQKRERLKREAEAALGDDFS